GEVLGGVDDELPNQGWEVGYGLVGLLVAAGFIWHCGRQSTHIERQDTLAESNIEGLLLRWMPRLLAALVPLGAALGLYTTIKEARTTASLVKSVADQQSWPEL